MKQGHPPWSLHRRRIHLNASGLSDPRLLASMTLPSPRRGFPLHNAGPKRLRDLASERQPNFSRTVSGYVDELSDLVIRQRVLFLVYSGNR